VQNRPTDQRSEVKEAVYAIRLSEPRNIYLISVGKLLRMTWNTEINVSG
jgi:hypothetical protein